MTRCGLMLGALMLAPGVAYAQAPPSPGVELFDEGQRLFEDGKIEAACEAFAKSAELERTVGVLLNLARCHATMGLIATAHREYVEAATLARENGQEERAKAAESLGADLEAKLPKLRVQVSGAVAGQIVSVDGKPLRPSAFGVALALDPGPHELKAEAPGRRPWQRQIEIANAAEEIVVTVPALSSLDEPPPEEEGTSGGVGVVRVAGFVVGGLGLASAIVGGVLGGVTISRVSDARDDPTKCPNEVCSPSGRDQIDGARTTGIVSTVLLAVGGAAIGAGVLMIVLDGGDDAPALAISPWFGPDGGGWSAHVRF